MTDEAHVLDTDLPQEAIQGPSQESRRVRAPRLAGAAEAGKVEGNDTTMAGELGDIVAPGLGESSQTMDERGSGPLARLDVMDEQAVEVTAGELDLGHVRSRAAARAARGTGRD